MEDQPFELDWQQMGSVLTQMQKRFHDIEYQRPKSNEYGALFTFFSGSLDWVTPQSINGGYEVWQKAIKQDTREKRNRLDVGAI